MTQNKFILGVTSSLIVLLALIYILNPFEIPIAYASEQTFIDKNEFGIISGKIQSQNSAPLSNIHFTINGYDERGNLIKIASGISGMDGSFNVTIDKSLIPVFHKHTIIILFTINGKTYKQTLTITLDDKTFKELFVENKFLPFPPFTVIAY